jgi:hypothetical protein
VTRALLRTSQVGAAAELGAGRWALVRGIHPHRSDTQAVDGSYADDETDSKPKPPRRQHTWSPNDKLLVVLALLTDASLGWSELVRCMKASAKGQVQGRQLGT